MLRNTLSDADDEGNLSLDSLLDTSSGQRRTVTDELARGCAAGTDEKSVRNEESGGGSASLLHSFSDILEYGQVEMCRAGFLGVCAADDLCSCRHLGSVPCPISPSLP